MRPALLLGIAGCLPDDWNGEPYLGPPSTSTSLPTDDTGTDPGDPALVGSWVSEGADLSVVFREPPFEYERVEATFEADGSTVTTAVASETFVLTGTYTIDTATDPPTIEVAQVEPYAATAQGLWEVDGDTLTFEVVQIVPDYGFVPPTPETGFGSTSGPGLVPGANVQTYRRDR